MERKALKYIDLDTPRQSEKVSVGDVICSSEFVNAHGQLEHTDDDTGSRYSINRSALTLGAGGSIQSNEIQRRPDGYSRKVQRIENSDCYDESRGCALFVVEFAKMDGGGSAHGGHDRYPDGWHVIARRLNQDGTYNPNGETLAFYQSGCFNCMTHAPVMVIGRLDFFAARTMLGLSNI